MASVVCALDVHKSEIILVCLEEFGCFFSLSIQVRIVVPCCTLDIDDWDSKCDSNSSNDSCRSNHEGFEPSLISKAGYLDPLSASSKGDEVRVRQPLGFPLYVKRVLAQSLDDSFTQLLDQISCKHRRFVVLLGCYNFR